MKMFPPVPADSSSLKTHRRQRLWQIWLPMAAFTLVLLGLALWIVLGGASQSRLWADIALIWLLAPLLAFSLVGIVLSGLAIYGMSRILQATPRLTGRLQMLVERAATGVRRAADRAAQPFIWVEQAKVAVRSAVRFLIGKQS